MSQPDNANTRQRTIDPEDRVLQEACLLYFKRYRRMYALPAGWTERCETYSDGSRRLCLTNDHYHVILYPGDTDVEPRADFTPPDGPLPTEEEVRTLFVQLFGNELSPNFVEHYVTREGTNKFMVACDHRPDPASPESSDN